MSKVGIDVSGYQGVIDWKKVKAAAIGFAILKVIRKDLNPDKQFERNWAGCELNGLTIQGVYNYSYATTLEKAVKDAMEVLKILAGRTPMVWLDVEDSCLKGLGKFLIDIINAYADVITRAGLAFGVYTGESFYNSYIKPYGGIDYPLWIARYGPNDGNMHLEKKPRIEDIEGWQFTSKGKVNGISGYVDMNVWYDDIKKTEGADNMSVKVGHASIDERKKIKGGAAGDQTGGEVCTRNWYSKPWSYVLRPTRAELAEKSAVACEQGCANSKIGYDQNQRNNLHTQAKKVGFDLSKITVACECDCSSFMHVCALAGGANIPYGSNGATTSTMKSKFTANGDYEVLTNSKYLTSDKYLKRGDILVKPGSHTVMVLGNGSSAGTTTGSSSSGSSSTPTTTAYSLKDFIKDVQKATGSGVDGIAGPETIGNTVTVSAKINRKHAVIKPLQKRLNALGYNCGTVDGIAGTKFTAAVNSYQKNILKYNNPDGEITAKGKMWKKLLGMI